MPTKQLDLIQTMAVPHVGTTPLHLARTAHPKSKSESLRRRLFATVDSLASRQRENSGATLGEESEWEREEKAICTTPGMACAGETETETDEPVRFFFLSGLSLLFSPDLVCSRDIYQRRGSQRPLPACRLRSPGRRVTRSLPFPGNGFCLSFRDCWQLYLLHLGSSGVCGTYMPFLHTWIAAPARIDLPLIGLIISWHPYG